MRINPIGICACGRQHDNIGVNRGRQVLWCCWDCLPHMENVVLMAKATLSGCERRAIEDGGATAGAYLDSIGKTDLGALSEQEWHAFLGVFLKGYGEAMGKLFERGGV